MSRNFRRFIQRTPGQLRGIDPRFGADDGRGPDKARRHREAVGAVHGIS